MKTEILAPLPPFLVLCLSLLGCPPESWDTGQADATQEETCTGDPLDPAEDTGEGELPTGPF